MEVFLPILSAEQVVMQSLQTSLNAEVYDLSGRWIKRKRAQPKWEWALGEKR